MFNTSDIFKSGGVRKTLIIVLLCVLFFTLTRTYSQNIEHFAKHKKTKKTKKTKKNQTPSTTLTPIPQTPPMPQKTEVVPSCKSYTETKGFIGFNKNPFKEVGTYDCPSACDNDSKCVAYVIDNNGGEGTNKRWFCNLYSDLDSFKKNNSKSSLTYYIKDVNNEGGKCQSNPKVFSSA